MNQCFGLNNCLLLLVASLQCNDIQWMHCYSCSMHTFYSDWALSPFLVSTGTQSRVFTSKGLKKVSILGIRNSFGRGQESEKSVRQRGISVLCGWAVIYSKFKNNLQKPIKHLSSSSSPQSISDSPEVIRVRFNLFLRSKDASRKLLSDFSVSRRMVCFSGCAFVFGHCCFFLDWISIIASLLYHIMN